MLELMERAPGGRHRRLPARARERDLRSRRAAFVPHARWVRSATSSASDADAGAPSALSQYRAPSVDRGPVDAVNGAFMLMRRAALDEVGLFDEGYWMYMEDLDLCYRFKQAGWTTWYEPSVTVIHMKGATSGRFRTSRLNYAFHYGMLRFYRKHYARTRNPVLNGAVYAGIGGKLALSLIASAIRRPLSRA